MDQNTQTTVAQLYATGMELFRNNRWAEALAIFEQIQSHGDRYPELENLIADIQLKLELERLRAPMTSQKPKGLRWPIYVGAGVLAVLFIAGGVFASGIASQPPVQEPVQTVRVVNLPTAAPTSTARPTATPQPTLTPEPTATPSPTIVPTEAPTVVPQPGVLLVQTANGEPLTKTTSNIAIILDASGSMLAKIGKDRKIDIARGALTTLIGQLADTTQVALSAYGITRANGCSNIQQLAPLAPLQRDSLLETIKAVEPAPNSPTPIGLALQKMAQSLAAIKSDTLLVLVSDGEETCDADPVAIAKQIHTDNPQIRVAVVGFNIGTDVSRARLSTIAESGGGTYFDASNAAQLVSALRQAITLTYHVIDMQGKEVYAGQLGSQITLDAGRYKVKIGDTNALLLDVDIRPAEQTSIQIQEKNGGIVGTIVTP